MLFEQILFFVAGLGAIAGALGVVMLRNPFYSVLSLVGHLVSLAVLFLLLTAAFIAAAQVVVYAGAVMVLYVFVVAYVGGSDEPLRRDEGGAVGAFGPIFAAAIFVEITIAVVGSSLGALDTRGADLAPGFGSPGEIGRLLLTKFLLPFEAASFLLLVAAVGAVVMARKRRGLEDLPELMDTSWFVVLSAFIFAIGAAGVLTRRSPLVILLCLELMLNAGNLALIAFSRMLGNQDGQVFALIVMVVAACEVVIGLGIIVAMYRRRLPIDVDEMSELRG